MEQHLPSRHPRKEKPTRKLDPANRGAVSSRVLNSGPVESQHDSFGVHLCHDLTMIHFHATETRVRIRRREPSFLTGALFFYLFSMILVTLRQCGPIFDEAECSVKMTQ